MTDENPFIRFWRQGYTRLLPVVPPEAGIRDAGKRPGLKGVNSWYGTSVRRYDATEADCRAWHEMGAGVGLRCDGTFIALDIDTLSPQWVKIIRELAFEHLGPAPIRIGRDPKELLLYLTDGAIDYQQMRFDDGVEDKKTGLVEMLTGAEGTKWFVMHGVHPVTKRPYRWPAGTPDAATLSRVTAEQVQTFFEALASVLPAAKGAGTVSADRAAIDQAKLKGDVEMIKRAIEAIPNDPGRIGYQEWMTMAAALRGACQDDYALGLELFQDWSEKADLDTQTENPARVYGSIQPPFSLGADYLFSKAAAEDPAFVAARYFDPNPPIDPEAAKKLPNAVSAAETQASIAWIDPAAWDGAPPKPREWDVEGWIPKREVTLVYGDGGIGKTLLFQQAATALATGTPWLGQPTQQTKVLCFLCEDDEDELHRRQIQINRALGVTMVDLRDTLRITSRRNSDNMLAVFDRNSNVMKLRPIWNQIRDDAISFGAGVIILDTLADIYSGDEIARSQVNLFVKACLGRLGAETGATIITLGHPSQAGKSSGAGTSGSTAWNNAVRSRLYLRYPKGVEKGNFRELEGMKSNYSARGNLLKLKWSEGAFAVIAGSTPVSAKDFPNRFSGAPGADGQVGRGEMATVADAAADAVMQALRERAGTPMNMKPNSHKFAPKLLKRLEPGFLEAFGLAEVESALGELERRGWITLGVVGRDASRRPQEGFVITPERAEMKAEADSSSIFE